jgi:hypothetical protein
MLKGKKNKKERKKETACTEKYIESVLHSFLEAKMISILFSNSFKPYHLRSK